MKRVLYCVFVKFWADLAGTLYEDSHFHAMSLFRVTVFTSLVVVVVAWVGEQFFEKPTAYFNSLLLFLGGNISLLLGNKVVNSKFPSHPGAPQETDGDMPETDKAKPIETIENTEETEDDIADAIPMDAPDIADDISANITENNPVSDPINDPINDPITKINIMTEENEMAEPIFKTARDLYVALSGTGGLNAYAATCQIWLESASTTSELARNTYNFAGIKATPAWKKAGGAVYAKQTKEYVNGKEVTVTAEFRKYSSPAHFFSDYATKWGEARYQDAGLRAGLNSFWLCFAALNTGGWATDIAYFKKLCDMADRLSDVFGDSWPKKREASLLYALQQKTGLTEAQRTYLQKLYGMTVVIPPISDKEPPQAVPDDAKTKWLIGLDAGHGGTDPGAVCPADKKIQEKNINLAVVKLINERLTADGYKTCLTRDKDVTVALNDRPKLLNKAGVSFTLSVHTNSAANGATAKGFEGFTYLNGSAKSKDLCNRMYAEWAAEFPDAVLRDDPSKTGMGKEANLAMVRDTKAPATLVELDFISNHAIAEKLIRPDQQQRMAKALYYAIVSYIQNQNQGA